MENSPAIREIALLIRELVELQPRRDNAAGATARRRTMAITLLVTVSRFVYATIHRTRSVALLPRHALRDLSP